MYESGTILALKEPQSTDDETYPYDRVEVVGQSPVHHPIAPDSDWTGADAMGYIVRPLTEFAGTVDKPVGLLNELYEIESFPTDPVTGEALTPENYPRHQPTPEQLLAAAAKNNPPGEKRKPLPSVQDDRKSPEQVLREAGGQPKRKPGRPRKDA